MTTIVNDQFLFAFDFVPPKPRDEVNRILFVHTASHENGEASLARLMELYPGAKIDILKREGSPLGNAYNGKVSSILYSQRYIPEDLDRMKAGKKIKEFKYDLALFGININFSRAVVGLWLGYENVFRCVKNLGLMDVCYVLDKDYQIKPLGLFDSWTEPHVINDHTVHLSWTLMTPKELPRLFNLAHSGPGEGAVVNIGHFQGGSTILLSKGSKLAGRGKVFSFDPIRFSWSDDILRKNDVEDWVTFTQAKSEDAAKEWAKREDTRIRLLFIDGDHSYAGCKKDVLNWAPFIVPGGMIAIHDYCNGGEFSASLTEIVKAVYDTILVPGGFRDFSRTDTLFTAVKE